MKLDKYEEPLPTVPLSVFYRGQKPRRHRSFRKPTADVRRTNYSVKRSTLAPHKRNGQE